ncbi:hypothetical protein ACFY7Z_08515 [Streptomyces sp. NPDC012623]|uniref:hypothetical protein n=1 Tax=unclassified Streptomyces TaxID=2593676 RepID=UPI0036B0EEB8
MTYVKSLTTLLAASAVAASLGLGAYQAVAATGPVTAVGAATGRSAADPAADLPVYRDWYWTEGNCQRAGRQGVERGHWDQYQCAAGDVYWHLWTNR